MAHEILNSPFKGFYLRINDAVLILVSISIHQTFFKVYFRLQNSCWRFQTAVQNEVFHYIIIIIIVVYVYFGHRIYIRLEEKIIINGPCLLAFRIGYKQSCRMPSVDRRTNNPWRHIRCLRFAVTSSGRRSVRTTSSRMVTSSLTAAAAVGVVRYRGITSDPQWSDARPCWLRQVRVSIQFQIIYLSTEA